MFTPKLLESSAGWLIQVGGWANDAALGWAPAKDTSMQGGSHGDRCVKRSSWRQVCTAVNVHAGGVSLTVAAGVVLQLVGVF